MNHRQHHPQGNQQIAELLEQNFQVPNLNSTALDVFKRVIYLSQLQQTLCIADEGSFYRRGRNMPYRTMGSLYWQLNQNWEAPSWTSIDFGGVWKVLHYAMADVYRSVHLSAFINETTEDIVCHIASDNLEDMDSVEVLIELIPFNVTEAEGKHEGVYAVDRVFIPAVPALSGVFFWKTSYRGLLQSYSTRCPDGGASCFVLMSAVDKETKLPIASTRPLWLAPVKTFHLGSATINITVQSQTNTSAVVELLADHVAPYTVIQTDLYYGRFNHNGMLLIPGRPTVLDYTLRQVPSKEGYRPALDKDFPSSLNIQCLNQLWND